MGMTRMAKEEAKEKKSKGLALNSPYHLGMWVVKKVQKVFDEILPRKGPVTRAMSKKLQEDWARAAEEGPRVLMSLGVDF